MTQRLDGKGIGKIEELVDKGVRSVDEIRHHLKIYIKDDLFRDKEQPQRSNRRYFPQSKTIKNHMYNAAMRARLSVMDQDNVQELIKKWKSKKGLASDKFYFRPYIKGSPESVIQSYPTKMTVMTTLLVTSCIGTAIGTARTPQLHRNSKDAFCSFIKQRGNRGCFLGMARNSRS